MAESFQPHLGSVFSGCRWSISGVCWCRHIDQHWAVFMSLKSRTSTKSSATAQQNLSPHLSSHYSINAQINTARVRERASEESVSSWIWSLRTHAHIFVHIQHMIEAAMLSLSSLAQRAAGCTSASTWSLNKKNEKTHEQGKDRGRDREHLFIHKANPVRSPFFSRAHYCAGTERQITQNSRGHTPTSHGIALVSHHYWH